MQHVSSLDVEILKSKTLLLLSKIDLRSCTIYLFAANDPVIEASSGLRFAPFNIGYPHLREQAAKAQLDPTINKWELIFDFSQKNESNFSVVPPSEWHTEIRTIEGFEDQQSEIVFEYPIRYGGTQSDEKPASSGEHDQTLAAFAIQTGQHAA